MATQTTPYPAVQGGSFLIEDRRPEEIFTPEDFSDEHRQIARTADQFFANEVAPNAERLEQKDYALTRELLRKAAEVGLTSIDIPERFGGMELDMASSAIVAEHMAHNGSFAASFGAHAGIGTTPILFFGSEEQKARYLPRLASAELISSYALTEAHAGSDALAARARAELTPDGRHYVLNGEKMWITNGGFADLYIVFAKVDGEKFTAFIVEKAFGGVAPGAEERKMGLDGSSTTPLILNDCKVPVENVLHEVGRGHIVAFNVLNMGRLKLGAVCVGGCKGLLQHAARYAKERKAFGKPIAEFGLIQQKLAQMAVRAFAAEGILYRTTGMIDALYERDREAADAGRKALEEYAVECAINKVYGSEALFFVADEAVQIYGGYGYHHDYPPERAFRDCRINRIFEGTNEINRLLTTGMLMKRAMSGQLALIPAAQRLMNEAFSGAAADADAVGHIKKMVLLAAGVAFQKHKQALADQQEVVAAISNIVMEAFVTETAQLRTRKMGGRSPQAEDMTAVLLYEAVGRAEAEAKTVLAACAEGDALRAQLAVLRRFTRMEPIDVVAARRRIAQRVLDAGRYLV
ncbi:MAG: acyl-CoA dehydrogenase family protein [Acidobacteria bacterium]|jgi:alkylation response protein AidB-like acyl-CoA dehydrogenase|nr:acyl-CoA dehydrogenase family protein [Acidobacteriota bacterium]